MIFNQTKYSLVQNKSENGKYNLISVDLIINIWLYIEIRLHSPEVKFKTIFRMILSQTKFYLFQNYSKNGKYNIISVGFT